MSLKLSNCNLVEQWYFTKAIMCIDVKNEIVSSWLVRS